MTEKNDQEKYIHGHYTSFGFDGWLDWVNPVETKREHFVQFVRPHYSLSLSLSTPP